MGSFASTLLSNSEELEDKNYTPSPEDVYEVRRYLLRWFPAELAIKIIDDAQYWPVVSTRADINHVINTSHGPFCCLVTPRLDNMILEESFRIKAVRFIISSHDQGWASENSFPSKYMGSWTWFEAAIIRYLREDEDTQGGVTSVQQMKGLIQSGGTATHPDITMVKNPETGAYTWHLQRNIRAWGEETVHEVTWTDEGPDDNDEDERQFIDKTGAGLGKGFVRLLERQDRIAVIAEARFPGWTNHIGSVEIQILYSV